MISLAPFISDKFTCWAV